MWAVEGRGTLIRPHRPWGMPPTLIQINRLRPILGVIDQDARAVAGRVVVLAVAQGPPESGHGHQAERQGERRQEHQDVHRRAPVLSAFTVTTREEPDMAIAATNGFTKPSMAAGPATRL